MNTDQDLEAIAQIKSMSADGKTPDQIREALGETVIVKTDEDQPTSNLAVIPAIIEQFESLDSKLDQVLEGLDRIENKP
jgi:DNA-binding transcriptional MerR regulator